jgi:hypothetical protein
LAGARCHDIDGALDLQLSLLLDPDGDLGDGTPLDPATQSLLREIFAESVDPELKELPPPNPPPGPIEDSKPKHATAAAGSASPDTRPSTESAFFDAGATFAIGELPGVGIGVGLHATLVTGIGWQLELGFASFPGRAATAPAGPGRAELDLDQASLALCPYQLWSMLALCGGAEYGRMSAAASGFARNAASSNQRTIDVIGLGVLRIGLGGPFFLRGSLAFVVPLLRNDYLYLTEAGERQLYRMGVVAGRFELGLGLRL